MTFGGSGSSPEKPFMELCCSTYCFAYARRRSCPPLFFPLHFEDLPPSFPRLHHGSFLIPSSSALNAISTLLFRSPDPSECQAWRSACITGSAIIMAAQWLRSVRNDVLLPSTHIVRIVPSSSMRRKVSCTFEMGALRVLDMTSSVVLPALTMIPMIPQRRPA